MRGAWRLTDAVSRMRHTPDARGVQHQAGSRSPPVDLLIRTGGERRLSDFLLWEALLRDLVTSWAREHPPKVLAKQTEQTHGPPICCTPPCASTLS